MKLLKTNAFLILLLVTGCTQVVYMTEDELNKSKTDSMNAEDLRVYLIVENAAEFPGGYEALAEYLSRKVKYPQEAIDARVEGTVLVEFVVEKNGSISNVRVRQAVHPLLDKEAFKAVKKMPRWRPGFQKGKAVRSIFIMPVEFQLAK